MGQAVGCPRVPCLSDESPRRSKEDANSPQPIMKLWVVETWPK